MADFVPKHFEPPLELIGTELVLEPLGPEHNQRDYAAWTSSIEHIRATPGLEDWSWPHEMTLEENLADLEMHARHFGVARGVHLHRARPSNPGRDRLRIHLSS